MSLRDALASAAHRPSAWLLALIAGGSVVMLWRMPVYFTDADTWIHLAHGRYIFEHGAIPSHTYFSFLTPAREMANYRWLFQALLYQVYVWWDYHGVVVLRSLAYLGAAGLVLACVFRREDDQAARLWKTFWVALVLLRLFTRYISIRPHMATYFFIPLFLYALEARPRWVIWLPLAAVVWCNLHGISYPVLLLICGAYLLDYFVSRRRATTSDPAGFRQVVVPLVLSMAAVYATPFSWDLFGVLFRPMSFLNHFVLEMLPRPLRELGNLSLDGFAWSYDTLFNLAGWMVLGSLISSWGRGRFRISHTLLAVAGAIVATRVERFSFEFLLLSLPLMRSNPMGSLFQGASAAPRRIRWTLAALVTGAVVSTAASDDFWGAGRPRAAYPLSTTRLPEGVVAFLEQAKAGGRILNWQNTGGYLRWKLAPRYQTFIEMDATFQDTDFYLSMALYSNPALLKPFLAQYDPSFITVSLDWPGFRGVVAEVPWYVPVFVDDAEVLYANARHYPELAAAHELKHLDPYALWKLPDAPLDNPDAVLPEIRRLLQVDPLGISANLVAGRHALTQGAYDRSLEHGRAIAARAPELPQGFVLMADAMRWLKQPRAALRLYAQGLRRNPSPEAKQASLLQIGLLHAELNEPRHAYRVIRQAVDVLAPSVDPDILFRFGIVAAKAGKRKEADAIFTCLTELRAVDPDSPWQQRVREARAELNLPVRNPEAGPHHEPQRLLRP